MSATLASTQTGATYLLLNSINELSGSVTRTPYAVSRIQEFVGTLLSKGTVFDATAVDVILSKPEKGVKEDSTLKELRSTINNMVSRKFDDETPTNFVIGRKDSKGRIAAYAYGSEVHFGTDAAAIGMLEYVKRSSPNNTWEIIKVGN